MQMSVSSTLFTKKTLSLEKLTDLNLEITKEDLIYEILKCINNSNLSYEDFARQTMILMDKLCEAFKDSKEKLYLIWTKYMDFAYKFRPKYFETPELELKYRNFNTDLFKGYQILNYNDDIKQEVDWRIKRKYLKYRDKICVKGIGSESSIKGMENIISNEILARIKHALNYLLWHNEKSKLHALTKNILEQLYHILNSDSETQAKVFGCIILGRIDKTEFPVFPYSLIFGDDGGLYILLNSFDYSDLLSDCSTVSMEFIEEKVINAKENKKRKKIILERVAFGKIRLAVSLFFTKNICPGQLICVKKTHNIMKIKEDTNKDSNLNILDLVVNSTYGDYFANNNEVSNLINFTRVIDRALILDKTYVKDIHLKGYVLMEMIPQNSAESIFSKTFYQDWDVYQKPFILEVFQQTWNLVESNVAVLDLNLKNTFFDPDNLKTSIIEIGKSVYAEGDPKKFDPAKFPSYEFNPEYLADELRRIGSDDPPSEIDLSKAMSYSCGKILIYLITSAEDPNQYPKSLKDIVAKLTLTNPQDRMSIKDAINEIKNIGDSKKEDALVFKIYQRKIKEKLNTNPSSISLKPNLFDVLKNIIIPKISDRDPEIYKNNLLTYDLSSEIEPQISSPESSGEKRSGKILLILGSPGSGKSVALQLMFMKAIAGWNDNLPIPIYFHLANETDLDKILQRIDDHLSTSLKRELVGKDLTLYIDGFDEGNYVNSDPEFQKENLIQTYLKKLYDFPYNYPSAQRRSLNMIISCRSEFLKNYSKTEYERWFNPELFEVPSSKVPQNFSFKIYYLLPVVLDIKPNDPNQEGEKKKPNITKTYIMNHIILKQNKKVEPKFIEAELQDAIKKIKELKIIDYITTGLLFEMVMITLPKLVELAESFKDSVRLVSVPEIYEQYVNWFIDSKIKNYLDEEKLQTFKDLDIAIKQSSSSTQVHDLVKAFVKRIGQVIAVKLYVNDQYRINKDDSLFQVLGYDSLKIDDVKKIPFESQKLYHILRLLPLKIEIRKIKQRFENLYETKTNLSKKGIDPESVNIEKEEIEIGFIHDTIKNSFLLEELKDECREEAARIIKKKAQINLDIKTKPSKILSFKYITEDYILLKFIADFIRQHQFHEDLIGYFLGQIELTKTIKTDSPQNEHENERILISASNCMTILVASKFNFSGREITNVKIKNANLSNGILCNSDFVNVDFTNVNMTNCKLKGSKFVNCNFTNVSLKTYPDLIRHSNTITTIKYSPDGKYIATGSEDNTIKIWNYHMGTCIHTLQGHIDKVVCLCISPDSKYLASASFDNSIKVWDISTGKFLQSLEEHENPLSSIEYSPDNKYLATTSYIQTKIFDTSNWSCFRVLQGHFSNSKGICFSPDSKFIVIPSKDGVINFWDILTGTNKKLLRGHNENVTSVSYSPNSKYLISSAKDDTIKIWDINQENTILDLYCPEVNYVTFSPDGKYFVSCSLNHVIKLWDTKTCVCLLVIQGNYYSGICAAFSPDNKYLAIANVDYTLKIHEINPQVCFQTLQGHSSTILCLTYSTDYLATGSTDNSIQIWDPYSGLRIRSVIAHYAGVTCVCYSNDGKLFSSGSEDNIVKVWNANLTKSYHILTGHEKKVNSLVFSPDAKYLASSSDDLTILLWSMNSGRCVRSLRDHSSSVLKILFTVDSGNIVSCSMDKTIKLWEPKSGKWLMNFNEHSEPITWISYSPDGKFLAFSSTDKAIRVLNSGSGKCVLTITGHLDSVECVMYSPDGRLLASYSSDKNIKLWNASNGACLQTIHSHHKITGIAFSPNGKYLATSHDMICKIWRISSGNQFLTLSDVNDNKISQYDHLEGKRLSLINEISLSETTFTSLDAIFENSIISQKNITILKQSGSQIDPQKNKIVEYNDDTSSELISNEKPIAHHIQNSIINEVEDYFENQVGKLIESSGNEIKIPRRKEKVSDMSTYMSIEKKKTFKKIGPEIDSDPKAHDNAAPINSSCCSLF